jgi:probable F420-dependent oxidoreductase
MIDELRGRLGSVGVWSSQFSLLPADRVRRAAAAVEELGYTAVWFPEAFGREAFTTASLLLEATERVTVASGIASIWARDATAAINGARALAEAYDGRFVLGLGVSHRPLTEVRGATYERPLSAMRHYLDAMEKARWIGPGVDEPAVMLAALGPRMLELATDRTQGAHPYFTPVEHTAVARSVIGPEAVLAPEQMVILETDPTEAGAIARRAAARYLNLPNYRNNLRRLGWTENDMADGGSDELIDAIIARGDLSTLAARVRDHHAAGADHVCVQVLLEARDRFPLEELSALADVLVEEVP